MAGDWTRLRELRAKLAALGKPTAPREIGQVLGEVARGIVATEFRRGEGPTGQAWEPLKRGHRTPLRGRGRLADDVTVAATAQGFALELPHIPGDLARAHQEGARIPARHVGQRSRVQHPTSGRYLTAPRAKRLKLVFDVVSKDHTIRAWTLPARPFFPTGSALPEAWAEKLAAAGDKWIREQFQAV